MTSSRRLPKFAGVGAIGFIIDAGILTTLMTGFGFHHYPARAISFGAAVTATWYLNRRWVFNRAATRMTGSEYFRYVVVQIIGATINLAVFVLAIELSEDLARIPVVPLAMGAALALLFNFSASSRFVFVAGPKRLDTPDESTG